MPVTIETIPIEGLGLVPGAPDSPPGRASVTPVSRIQAQALLDDLAYRVANTPAANDPWPEWRARVARAVFGVLPNYYQHWVSTREGRRWEAEFGPLAVSCWTLRIEASEALPRLLVQRIAGQNVYFGHWTNRALLTAARLEGLPSLECEVYED